jgi:uncharacterized membrane protein YgcG
MNGSTDFERDLERELHRILDPIAAAPVPPRRTLASRGLTRRLLGGAGAALGIKVLTGFALAAFAAAAAGAATEAVVTRSLNPVDWGQQVHQALQQAAEGTKSTPDSGKTTDTKAGGKDNAKAKGDAKSAGKSDGKSDGKSNSNSKSHGGGSNGNGNGHGNGNGSNADGNATSAEPIDPAAKHPGPSPVPGD